ncbi:hypothetical protein RclHR1_00910031 [Rhizophagus clarus]|uniref:Uncharacterized protein n=1 Tax=Rhizophagus clarus TaxID=94130 RepID=A0A2Z6S5J3_9GLOM|nr:hypothetical protein RclHR1_00910031 [Rhizophagus clarus]GES75346.1 hypothetical protein GLOIN_2v1475459 [Rhizophagus clarus]
MATKIATPKTRKPKANNFVLVLEQFLEKHKLMADSAHEQLSEHTPELDALLSDWMARRCVKVALTRGTDNRRSFSKEKIEALLPDKRKGKLTIEKRTEYCAKAGDFVNIIANHWALGPKNKDENEIIAGASHQSTFCAKLAEGGVEIAIIDTFAKNKKLIQDSNKIQKKRTKKRMANLDTIPIHFSLANVQKRIQNMDVSKTPTREDLADVIVMLSMRPAEAGKLRNPVYTGSGTCNAWPFNKFLKQEPYRTKPKNLRDYGSKHASRIHGGKKPTPQHLKLLSRIAMRQESDRLNAGDNYAIGDMESEYSSPENEHNSEPESESAENDEISDIINMYSY